MSMQIMMGIVIAIGFGAAVFLVSNGFKNPAGFTVNAEGDVAGNSDDENSSGEMGSGTKPENAEMYDNIERSIAANPGDRQRAYKYGMALIGLKEFPRAEKFYLEQLDLFPADIKIAYGLAWCYEQHKSWDKAVRAYQTALLIDKTHRESKNNLAWLLATAPDAGIRNGARAVALATQAVGYERPPNPYLMDTLAAAYAEVGSFDNAIRIQRYVVRKLDGDHPGVEKRLQLYLKQKPYRLPK